QNQGATRGRNGTSRVAVGPVAEGPQANHGQESAQQRPSGRQPTLQHPADGRAHEAHAQPHTPIGMPYEHLTQRYDQALSGKKLRGVAGLPEDMETLEMDPQGVSGIGQSSVRESVR